MRVHIYWNLHRKCWTIQQRGRVYGYADWITLSGVTFVVREAGRQRVLRERRKNVHAFVVGDLVGFGNGEREPDSGCVRARYNPYEGPDFTCGGEPIRDAPHAVLTGGRVYVQISQAPLTQASSREPSPSSSVS